MVEEANKLEHLAIIMDGNRRWAKINGKSKKEGHREGANKLTATIDWCIELDIKYLTVYAFSIENWKRDASEINDLMSLLKEYLSKQEDNFNKKGIKIKVIGVEDNIQKDILDDIRKIEKNTKNNNVITVNIAFNYTGRREITDATKNIARDVKDGLIKIEDIKESLFNKYLYYENIPDPDLLIRTSGEYRISNFLLWEIANSELFFTNTLWPDFSKDILVDIINNFKKRERRYGGTISK